MEFLINYHHLRIEQGFQQVFQVELFLRLLPLRIVKLTYQMQAFREINEKYQYDLE